MKTHLNTLKKKLQHLPIEVLCNENALVITQNSYKISITFKNECNTIIPNYICLPIDYLITSPDKIVYFIQSKLQLNKTIYARLCEIKKIDKPTATTFLNTYHFLNSANSAYNYGLFYKDELLCVASFSKGRKMNRLLQHQRSFELIRFCTKGGITVTGGLSKLIKHFCAEKNPGDIMTYIDKQFSDGKSFIKAGFKLHSETNPNYFLINKKTFERILIKENNPDSYQDDEKQFYKTSNFGNLKLVFTPSDL